MPSGRTRPLTRRYTLGVAAVALPLLLLAGGLAGTQFAAERAAQLELIARDLGDLRDELEALSGRPATTCSSFASSPRTISSGRIATPTSPLRALLRSESLEIDGQHSNAVLLDSLAGTQAKDLVGNLHGRVGLEVARGGNPLEIDMALNLFEPMRLAHLTNSHLQWSYYFSGRGDFLVVYPFAAALTSCGRCTRRRSTNTSAPCTPTTSTAWLLLHGIRSGTATGRRPIRCWRGRVDGQPCRPGLCRRCASRAWWAPTSCSTSSMGRSAGSIDRLAGYGSSTIAAVCWPTVSSSAPRAAEAPSIADALPEAIAALPLAQLLEPSTRPRKVGGWELMALPLGAAPWHVVFVADEAEITALVLARLWPYALLLGGVLVTLIIAQYLLQRYFVGPAIALAGRVQDQSNGELEPSRQVCRRSGGHGSRPSTRPSTPLAGISPMRARGSAQVGRARGRIRQHHHHGRGGKGPGAQRRGREHLRLSPQRGAGPTDRRADRPAAPARASCPGDGTLSRHGRAPVLGRRIEIDGLHANGSVFPVELRSPRCASRTGACSPPICATSASGAARSRRCRRASAGTAPWSRTRPS